MAGLMELLFGKRTPDTDPLPGIGGYDSPRGPVGEGGFPGSTPAAPITHPQSTDGRRERQLTPEAAQDQWKELPTRQRSGQPRQPRARNKAQADDTLRSYTPIVGANAPGSQNVRNSVAQRYKAVPGVTREYLSAPNPAINGGKSAGPTDADTVIGGNPTPVIVQSRFVSMEGAQESFATDRQIPYKIHHRSGDYQGAPSNRGADLDGLRYTMASKEQIAGLPNGQFGIARRRATSVTRRPVRFEQPGPWTANFRDEAPDSGSNAPNMVLVSASRKPAAKSSSSRANAVETRKSVRKVRRG